MFSSLSPRLSDRAPVQSGDGVVRRREAEAGDESAGAAAADSGSDGVAGHWEGHESRTGARAHSRALRQSGRPTVGHCPRPE